MTDAATPLPATPATEADKALTPGLDSLAKSYGEAAPLQIRHDLGDIQVRLVRPRSADGPRSPDRPRVQPPYRRAPHTEVRAQLLGEVVAVDLGETPDGTRIGFEEGDLAVQVDRRSR